MKPQLGPKEPPGLAADLAGQGRGLEIRSCARRMAAIESELGSRKINIYQINDRFIENLLRTTKFWLVLEALRIFTHPAGRVYSNST